MQLAVYWINLNSSCARRDKLLIELQRVGIDDHQRVAAVCPADLSSYNIIECSQAKAIIAAEWCCTISHLKAIWTALHDGQEVAMIIEDDVQVIRSPVTAWDNICKSVGDKQWDVLQLIAFGDMAIDLMTDEGAPLWVPWRSGLWSTGGYVISRAGMKKILDMYAPKTLGCGAWPENACIDFSRMPIRDRFTPASVHDPRARCVADWALYVAVKTLTCTDVFLNEAANDSTIKTHELPLHNKTIQAITSIAKLDCFKLPMSARKIRGFQCQDE